MVVANHGWRSESTDGPTGGWSCVLWKGCEDAVAENEVEDDEVEDNDVKGDEDDDVEMVMLRRRKMMMWGMMMLRQRPNPKTQGPHFVRACAVEMHANISQERFQT